MTPAAGFPLRPFLPGDTMALRELFAQSIEELTADDYDEDQRIAWASVAEDAQSFAQRLGGMLTLVVQVEGEYLGFASLKDDKTIDMLFVHPYYAGEGVGTALCRALEKIAAARGAETFLRPMRATRRSHFSRSSALRPSQRNSVPLDDQWLSNTTMIKRLKPASSQCRTRKTRRHDDLTRFNRVIPPDHDQRTPLSLRHHAARRRADDGRRFFVVR